MTAANAFWRGLGKVVQALGLEWLREHVDELEPRVYGIPDDIDREVSRRLSPVVEEILYPALEDYQIDMG